MAIESGTTGALGFADHANYDIVTDLTISTWVNFASLPVSDGDDRYVVIHNGNYAFGLVRVAGVTYLRLYWWQGDTPTNTLRQTVKASPVISVDTWTHIVAQAQANDGLALYINGVDQAAITSTAATGLARVLTDLLYVPSTGPMIVRMQETAMWNAVLTPSEITALSKRVSPEMIRPASLKQYASYLGARMLDKRTGQVGTFTVGSGSAYDHTPMIYPRGAPNAQIKVEETPGADSYDAIILATAGLVRYLPLSERYGLIAHDLKGGGEGVFLNTPQLGAPSILPSGRGLSTRFYQTTMQGAEGVKTGIGTVGSPFNGLSAFSYETWMKAVASPRNSGAGGGGPLRNNTWGFDWDHPTAADRQSVWITVGGTIYKVQLPEALGGVVYHIAATYDGETLRLYQNGVLVTSNATPSGDMFNSSDIYLAGGQGDGFDGWLAKTALYTAVLTPAQVLAHYQAGLSQLTAESGGSARLGAEIWDATGSTFLGFIPTLIDGEIEENINELKKFRVSMPAAAPNIDLIVEARELRLIREGEGEVFRGYIEGSQINAGDGPVLTVTGISTGAELVEDNTYYSTDFSGDAETQIDQLLTDTGWTSKIEAGLTNSNSWRSDGQSKWAAAQLIADLNNAYIRETRTIRELEIKSTHSPSGCVLINFERAPVADGRVGVVPELRGYFKDASGIVNRLIPFGAGEGGERFDLGDSNRSAPYTIQATNLVRPTFGNFNTFALDPVFNPSQNITGVTRSGENRLLILSFFTTTGTGNLATASVGGIPAIFISRQDVVGWQHEMWYVPNPPVGTGSLPFTVTFSSGGVTGWSCNAMSFSNVDVSDPVDPIGAFNSTNGNSGTAQLTITSVPNSLLIGHALGSGIAGPWTNDVDWTSIITSYNYAAYYAADGEAVTWTRTGPSDLWTMIIAALKGTQDNLYIEDAASVLTYRRRVRGIHFKDLHISGDIIDASNALYDLAASHLQQVSQPLINYGTVQPEGLGKPTWLVGDTARLIYRGLAETPDGRRIWVNIDEDAIIAGQIQRFNADGTRSLFLNLSNSRLNKQGDLRTIISRVDALERQPAG